MRAIGVTEYGGPEALGVVDVEPEDLGEGQVRVRVTAAAVSPTDTMVRFGARAETSSAPTVDVPGMDVAGTVVELGAGVGGLAVGDRVVGVVVPDGEHGAYRDEIVLPATSVVAAPSGATDAEASTLPMNGLTARYALDLLDVPAGGTLAVTGAAGTLGGYVIALAKAAGLVVVADAKDDDRELVTSSGADVVLPRGEGFAAAVRSRWPDGVDALVDGSVQGADVVPAVRDGGKVATVRGWRGDEDERVSFHPVWIHRVAQRRDWLEQLVRHVEDGTLALRVADVLPADQAAEAHRRLESGGLRGRLVLDLA